MLIVLSPSKTLDFDTPPATAQHSPAEFSDQSELLVESLKSFSPEALSKLMGMEEKTWLDVIKKRVPPKFIELNEKAFLKGRLLV